MKEERRGWEGGWGIGEKKEGEVREEEEKRRVLGTGGVDRRPPKIQEQAVQTVNVGIPWLRTASSGWSQGTGRAANFLTSPLGVSIYPSITWISQPQRVVCSDQ